MQHRSDCRFVNDRIFALKGGGYGCLFSLAGIDEEGLTDQELEAQMRSIEGALRGLPEGSCLYQYTRVMSGFDLPRKAAVRQSGHTGLRRRPTGFSRKDGGLPPHRPALVPDAGAAEGQRPSRASRRSIRADTSRMLADLEKTATLLEGHLGSSLGLRLLEKNAVYPVLQLPVQS